jgi:NAD(P)-dependent dehydrogenase (short-subunit alcohol dehydrogenase family)
MAKNRTALITGGTRGIGLGIAKELAAKNFDLVLNGMRPGHQVSEVLAEVESIGGQVAYAQGNIGSATGREKIIQTVKDEFGQLNVLVNNAGVAPMDRNDILRTTEESYDRVMDINLKGCYFLTQLAANWMVYQKEENDSFVGCIVNVSSVSATTASVNRGEYCISKAGIAMVTQLFAVRLGDFGIPVYEVRPGVIKTDMTAGVQEKYDRLFKEGIAVQKHWGLPKDVGLAVAALAEMSFPYSTGQVIMVDGGLTIRRL